MASQETTNAIQDERLKVLENEMRSLKSDRDSALKWGIITLGTAVIGLLGWIFTTFAVVFNK